MCITSAALMAASATSTGGLAALAVKTFFVVKKKGKENSLEPKSRSDDHDKQSNRASESSVTS
jgi:hypothetical protein